MTNFILSDDAESRIRSVQILRTGEFSDARYGRFKISSAMLAEMEKNFKKGVRGIKPALDYKHESDDVAAGWFKDVYLKNDSSELWADIEMTPKGEKVLSDKEFGYISADFETEYQDNESLEKFGCVLMGAGLTNRPVIKRMESVIQLSEKEVINNEGANKMNLEEMTAKCAELEKKCSEQDAMIADLKSKLEPKAEEEAKPNPELEVELSNTKKELAEVKGKLELAEKESEFKVLLSEGKAVEAQRESFLSGNFKEFLSKSVAIKLSEQGHAMPPKKEEEVNAEDEVLSKAIKLSEEGKISLKEAISTVLLENKELAEKINK